MAQYVELVSMNLLDPNLRPSNGGYQSIEPGTYDFEITKVSTGQSASGRNTLKVTAKVIGPQGSPMVNRTINQSFVISDEEWARARMLGFIQGVGAQLDGNGSFAPDALAGLCFTADVTKRAGKTLDKMGQEVEREYTQWERERPIEDSVEAAPAPARPAAPVAPAAPGRRAPATNGRPQPPR